MGGCWHPTLARMLGLVASLTACGTVTQAACGASPASTPETSIQWRPCPEDEAFSCTALRLPVDLTLPAGRRLTWRSQSAGSSQPTVHRGRFHAARHRRN
jgi:hypothetical protein